MDWVRQLLQANRLPGVYDPLIVHIGKVECIICIVIPRCDPETVDIGSDELCLEYPYGSVAFTSSQLT